MTAKIGSDGARICRDIWSGFFESSLTVDDAAEQTAARRLLDFVMDRLDSSEDIEELRDRSRGSTFTALSATEIAVDIIEKISLPEPPIDPDESSDSISLESDSGEQTKIERNGNSVRVSKSSSGGKNLEISKDFDSQDSAQSFADRVAEQARSRGQREISRESSTSGERYQEQLSAAIDEIDGNKLNKHSLDSIARAAIAKAKDDAERREKIVSIALGRGDTDELLEGISESDSGIVDGLLGSSALRDFVEVIGRFVDSIRGSNLPEKISGNLAVDGITTTNKISDLVPSEIALLVHPETRNLGLVRYVSGQSIGYLRTESGSRSSGDFLIALDVSGSMNRHWPTPAAYAVAAAIVAADEGRSVRVSVFNTQIRNLEADISNPSDRLRLIKEMLGLRPSGGTDFRPVVEACRELPPYSDLLFISDGDGDLDEDSAREVFQTHALAYLVIGGPSMVNPILSDIASPERTLQTDILTPEAAHFAAAVTRG